MPATAGPVRMPANNRVHSSAALQTHGIWQSTIGYDPYAPANKDKGSETDNSAAGTNAYEAYQGLLSRIRVNAPSGGETRGACKKCGRIGHLSFECRNFLSLRDEKRSEENDDSALKTATIVFEKIKKEASGAKEGRESEDDEDDEISSNSDSDIDPEIERIIAERCGKPLSKKVAALNKKRSNSRDGEEEGRKRRHRHKKSRRSHQHHRRSSSGSSADESDSDGDRKHKRRRMREESDSDGGIGSERHGKRRHKERRSVLSSESESTASSSDEGGRRKRREKKRSRGHRRRERE